MKVFVTGGTGFVGLYLLEELLAAGHTVRCLVRAGSEGKLPLREGIEVRLGDVTDPSSLEGSLEGCEALIHLVGIIREFPARGITFERLHTEATRNVVAAAALQGVRRYVQMSANGARLDAATPYHRTKWDAEEAVRSSGLAWTIFRPSLIFGPGDQFINMLADLIRRAPLVPVIGNGRYQMAPIAVEDVVSCFVRALEHPASSGQTYHLCGPASYSYDEILDLIGEALGRGKVAKLHQPLWLMRPLIALGQALPAFPITSAQLTMLLEGNVCPDQEWAATFGLTPRTLPEGIRLYLAP